MWRGESCASGCLSGWKFPPGAQETRKQKTQKNGNWYCWTDTVAKTSRKPKKQKTNKQFRPMERVWGEAGQVTWGETFLFFVFSMGFGAFLGQRAQTSRKSKKTKVSTHGEGLRRSWTGDTGWNFFCLFFFVFPWVLGHSWAKVAKTSRKQKTNKTKSFDPWRGSEEVLVLPWFWTSFLYESLG